MPSNAQSLNRYTYVLNDPCNLVDPLGLRCKLKLGLMGQSLDFGARKRIADIFENAGGDVEFIPNGKADFNIWQNVPLGVEHWGDAGQVSHSSTTRR
jgi:hypothetical protein